MLDKPQDAADRYFLKTSDAYENDMEEDYEEEEGTEESEEPMSEEGSTTRAV